MYKRQLMKTGKYPTNDEFFTWLEVYEQPILEKSNDSNDDGCCGGGCCC